MPSCKVDGVGMQDAMEVVVIISYHDIIAPSPHDPESMRPPGGVPIAARRPQVEKPAVLSGGAEEERERYGRMAGTPCGLIHNRVQPWVFLF